MSQQDCATCKNKIQSDEKCVLCTSQTAWKTSLSTLRSGKMSRLYSLTSSGYLHLRAHSSFCLVLLYFLRMVFHLSQQGSLWRNLLTQTPLSVSLCIPCSWHYSSGTGFRQWSIFQTSECRTPKHRSCNVRKGERTTMKPFLIFGRWCDCVYGQDTTLRFVSLDFPFW